LQNKKEATGLIYNSQKPETLCKTLYHTIFPPRTGYRYSRL